MQDPTGRITTFGFTFFSELVRIQGPDQALTTLTYGSNHLLQNWVNPTGEQTTVNYAATFVQQVQLPTGDQRMYATDLIHPQRW